MNILTASELKAVVNRAISRHEAWSKAHKAHKLDVKNLPFPIRALWREGVAEPRILPGGKHMLLLMEGQLQLWTIEPQECIWTAPRCAGQETCLIFEFELIDNGKKIRVATIDVDEESRANVLVHSVSSQPYAAF